MTKTSGLGDDLLVGGYHIGSDTQQLSITGGQALIDVTDITQSAHSRLGGLRDGSMDLTVYHDPAPGQAHVALSELPTADVVMTYLRSTTLGAPAACLNAKQVGYDPTRSNSGELTIKTAGQGNGFGLEWGVQLTPGVRTDNAATNGAGLDQGAATAYGAQAYLQAVALTGTDATVTIQHSADGSTWSSLMAFAEVTAAPGAQRISVANATTVDRYVRVITTTSAGFTAFSFVVVFVRNPIAGVVF